MTFALLAASTLTLMSYNIRGGLGMDGFWDISRSINVVKKVRPDVLCLQEVDVGTDRSYGAREPQMMGHILRPIWRWSFSKTLDTMNGEYGIAMLYEEKPLKTEKLLYPKLVEKNEPRSLLVNEFKDYVVCSTHMSLIDEERPLGLKTIDGVLVRYASKPVFVCGDWNATPDSAFVKEMEKRFVILNDKKVLTAPASKPDCMIDYIAVDKAHAAMFKVLKCEVMDEPEASDHRPVYVKLEY